MPAPFLLVGEAASASVHAEQRAEQLLASDLSGAGEALDINRAVVEELDLPTLTWERERNHDRLGPVMAQRIGNLQGIKLARKSSRRS